MSRIGKLPVTLPSGVKADVQGTTVKVEGPKGKLEKTFNSAVAITLEDSEIKVAPAENTRFARAMYGTARSIIGNMVQGVVDEFSKRLEITGVGFNANLQGQVLTLKLGYSHDIKYQIPQGVSVNVEGGTKLTVSGIDKHMVGQAAASIKKFAPIEPYKGKGVRIVGEHVIRKEGKSVA